MTKGDKVESISKFKVKRLPIADIVFDEYQPRGGSKKFAIDDLAKDMRERGLIYPVIVNDYFWQYDLLDGERRVRAAMLNNDEFIEAIVLHTSRRLDTYELQAVANFKRVENKIHETAKWLERFKVEFAEQYPDDDPIARVIELTGYSRTYFESADAINRAEDSFRDKVYDEKIGGYAATEIEGAVKDEDMRLGLRKTYEEAADAGVSLSALAPRVLKSPLRDIENSDEYTPTQKGRLAADLMKKHYKFLEPQTENGAGGNYLVYLETIRQWARDLEEWTVVGIEEKHLKHLAGELTNLTFQFNIKRELYGGKISPNPAFKKGK